MQRSSSIEPIDDLHSGLRVREKERIVKYLLGYLLGVPIGLLVIIYLVVHLL